MVTKAFSICISFSLLKHFIFEWNAVYTHKITVKYSSFLAIIKTKEYICDIIKASSTYKLVTLSVLFLHNPHSPVTMFTNPNEYYAAQI